MATKKVKAEPDGLLVSAAKTIGAAAGKIMAAAGISPTEEAKPVKPMAKHVKSPPLKAKKAAKRAVKSKSKSQLAKRVQ